MILNNHFYTVEEQRQTDNGWICRLSLNASHPIYQAHFPGHPVTPGVCIIQLAKEIASLCYAKPFFLCGVKNAKFLRVINPLEQTQVFVHLLSCKTDEQGKFVVSMAIRDDASLFSSLTLILQPAEASLQPLWQDRMEALRLCVVIPTYNNDGSLAEVLRETLRYTRSVIVVNDGSTDRTEEILAGFADRIDVLSYARNRGKGYALKQGFKRAWECGYAAAITMDSDGQHDARDLDAFIRAAQTYPGCFLIGQRTVEGHRPAKNTFANRFSNFWFMVHTGRKLQDTQNGFRLYPLAAMQRMHPYSSRYEAELELLVRAAWKSIPTHPVPVRVYYSAAGRVSHFRPGMDFLRISLLNTLFTFLAVLYGYPRMMAHKLFPVKRHT
jgi:3-hydroxymyristoyl/3-hydroxydecanoyl-(acyl carrier protein) dehydratase